MLTTAKPLRAAWLITAFALVACGGEAIIDAVDGGGGSGATSSTSTSSSSSSSSGSGGTSTTTGPCDCTTDMDCPIIDDACFYYACNGCTCIEVPLPAGDPCMIGVCDGNYGCVECLGQGDCFAGETCIDNYCIPPTEIVCQQVCGQLEACMGPFPECSLACIEDLSDCSGAEIDQVVACGTLLMNCDYDAWDNCMMSIGCINLSE